MTDEATGPTRRACLALLTLAPLARTAQAQAAPAALPRLMQDIYGRPERASGAWHARYQDRDYVLSPVGVQEVDAPGGRRLYLLVGGSVGDGQVADPVTPGLAGAHVYEERAGRWSPVAATRLMPVGSSGIGPEDARLVQLGPDHYHGWMFRTVATGQGHIAEWNHLLAPLGRRFVTVASLLAARDNEGAHDCEGRSPDPLCERHAYALTIDSTDPMARVWPLRVRSTGQRGGRAVPERQWRIAFDTRQWRYAVPADLREW